VLLDEQLQRGPSRSLHGLEQWLVALDPRVPVIAGGDQRAWSKLLGREVTATASSFEQSALQSAERAVVVAIGAERERLRSLSAESGVMPVLLGRSPSVNPLAEAGVVELSDASQLAAHFAEPSGAALLELTRLRPTLARAAIVARWERVLEAIRGAGGLCIYGSGTIGRQALAAARRAGLPVLAFIDSDPRRRGARIDGVEVQSVDDIVPGRSVVLPAVGRHAQAISAVARERGAAIVLGLSELYWYARPPAEPEPDYLDDLYANRLRYQTLFATVADARSRQVLSALIRQRQTLELAPLAALCERDHAQWFAPELLPRPRGEVFVDGGAFDGDTVRGYIAACGESYAAIHAFELDPEVAARGTEGTRDLRAVRFSAIGLSDRARHVAYRSTGSTDSAVIGEALAGQASAEVGRLDDLVSEPISFLKLDVEGEEARALAGAVRHLEHDHPTLALAIYHKAADLWDLPRRTLEISPSYRLRIRHYTELAYETVLYAT
jgi:FkbM family methyltransferase